MALNINRIFNMTMTIRNFLGSSRSTTFVRLFHNSHPKFATEKGTSNILDPQPWDYKDMPDIMKKRNTFKWCTANSQVYDMVNNNKNISGNEAVKALVALLRINKENKESVQSIKEKKEFLLLCEVVHKNLRTLSNEQIVDALKTLLFFDVPASSIIVESLLQMIRQSLNTLPLEQMSFIHMLLRKAKVTTPLGETLKLALPIVFEANLKTKLDTSNIDSVTSALKFLSITNDFDESKKFILYALQNNTDLNISQPDQAVDILMTVYNLKDDKNHTELIKKLDNIVIQNIDNIHLSRLEFIIRKISLKLRYSDEIFYNEGLIESIIQTVISRNAEVASALRILASLNNIRYASTSLLDYVAAKCYEDKSIIDTLTAFQIVDIFCAMSLADYKPIFWDSLKDLLFSERILLLPFQRLLRIALFLASLDCYWPELLNQIFDSTNFPTSITSNINYKGGNHLLLLHHAVSTFNPEYTGPLLSDNILEMFKKSSTVPRSTYFMKAALELSLGGPQYVKTHIETEIGMTIDHAVIMRKGGFPIAINPDNDTSSMKLSDLQAIPDSQVLLFMYITSSRYARNTQRLTAIELLRMKLIKSKVNYTFIPVISSMWESFTELEQSRYISQAIKLKTDKLSASINS